MSLTGVERWEFFLSMWPFKRDKTPDSQPSSSSSGDGGDAVSESVTKLFQLALDRSMPLEVRRVALGEMAASIASRAGGPVSSVPTAEYVFRIKLFLVLSVLGLEVPAGAQLLLAVECDRVAALRRHGRTIEEISQLSRRLAEGGQPKESVILLGAALRFGEVSGGSSFPEKVNLYANLATACFHSGRFAEAELMRRRELPLRRQGLGEAEDAMFILCQEGLADAIAAQDRMKQAWEIYASVCQQFQQHDVYMNSPAMSRIRKKIDNCLREES